MEGYGLFWAITELLFTNNNMIKTDFATLAFQLHSKPEKIKSIVKDFELFEVAENTFKSKDVGQKIKEIRKKSKVAKENILKRWHSKPSDTGVLPPNNDSNTIKESKENKRKGNKKKGEEESTLPPPSQSIQLNTPPPELIPDNRPPTAHEVRQFFDAEGYTEDAANRMFAAYDWTVFPFKSTVNGSTFKDWQAKARKQWFKEEDKKPKKKISNGGIIV